MVDENVEIPMELRKEFVKELEDLHKLDENGELEVISHSEFMNKFGERLSSTQSIVDKLVAEGFKPE